MKCELKLIFLKYIHDKIQLHQLQTVSMAEKNCFDVTRLISQINVSRHHEKQTHSTPQTVLKFGCFKTCQSGLYHLHNMGRINRFLSSEDGKSIVQAIAMSRIDYCDSLYCMVLPLQTLASSNGCKTRQSDWFAHCEVK